MIHKKGAELSLNFIIIAAIVLVVLIVAILFFTGAGKKLIGEQAEVTKLSTQEYALALNVCKLACLNKDRIKFDNPSFTEALVKAEKTRCSDFDELGGGFDDECLSVCKKTGETDKNCAAFGKAECETTSGCSWQKE